MSTSQIHYLQSMAPVTHYHTILTFNHPKEEGFGTRCKKRRQCLKPAFSSFTIVFSTLSGREIIILATFNLSSANAFNLVTSEILSIDKEVTHYHTLPHFDALKIYSCGKHWEKRRNCL